MIQCRLKHLQARCRERGYSLDEVRDCIVEQHGDRLLVDEHHPSYPAKARGGAGSELREILRSWLGLEASPGCSCESTAAKMDAMGPSWCRGEGMEEILDAMRAEHKARSASGLTALPWSSFAAKRLVLLACSRAESARVY